MLVALIVHAAVLPKVSNNLCCGLGSYERGAIMQWLRRHDSVRMRGPL
jgi:hypothetical protein